MSHPNLPEQSLRDWDELQIECPGRCRECSDAECLVREEPAMDPSAKYFFDLGLLLSKVQRRTRCR